MNIFKENVITLIREGESIRCMDTRRETQRDLRHKKNKKEI